MDLHTIVYLSLARTEMSAEQLKAMLSLARERNEHHGVTGMLLYRDGEFIQAIEGPREAVLQLYANIARDRRHAHVTKTIDRPIRERQFSDWSMGFEVIEDDDVVEVRFSKLFDGDFESRTGNNETGIYDLLKMFRDRQLGRAATSAA